MALNRSDTLLLKYKFSFYIFTRSAYFSRLTDPKPEVYIDRDVTTSESDDSDVIYVGTEGPGDMENEDQSPDSLSEGKQDTSDVEL